LLTVVGGRSEMDSTEAYMNCIEDLSVHRSNSNLSAVWSILASFVLAYQHISANRNRSSKNNNNIPIAVQLINHAAYSSIKRPTPNDYVSIK